jgi:hypothetical protein
MIHSLRARAAVSLLALATTFGAARTASAIQPVGCGPRHSPNATGGDHGFFTEWDELYLADIEVWWGPAGGFGNVVNGMAITSCNNTNGLVCKTHTVGSTVGSYAHEPIDWQSGERITYIQGGAGWYLDGFQFFINGGNNPRWSPFFGGHGGDGWAEIASGGEYFSDFLGVYGSVIDWIMLCKSSG